MEECGAEKAFQLKTTHLWLWVWRLLVSALRGISIKHHLVVAIIIGWMAWRCDCCGVVQLIVWLGLVDLTGSLLVCCWVGVGSLWPPAEVLDGEKKEISSKQPAAKEVYFSLFVIKRKLWKKKKNKLNFMICLSLLCFFLHFSFSDRYMTICMLIVWCTAWTYTTLHSISSFDSTEIPTYIAIAILDKMLYIYAIRRAVRWCMNNAREKRKVWKYVATYIQRIYKYFIFL